MTRPCSARRPKTSTRAAAGIRRTAAASVVQVVMAAADPAVAAEQAMPGPRACPGCGSAGRCEGRLPTTDGGWVCRAAQAMGLFQGNGNHLWVRLRSGPEAGRR